MSSSELVDLPEHWSRQRDSDDHVYYYNDVTLQTQWEAPQEEVERVQTELDDGLGSDSDHEELPDEEEEEEEEKEQKGGEVKSSASTFKKHRKQQMSFYTAATWADVDEPNLLLEGYVLKRGVGGWDLRYCRLESKGESDTMRLKLRFYDDHSMTTTRGKMNFKGQNAYFMQIEDMGYSTLHGNRTTCVAFNEGSRVSRSVVIDLQDDATRDLWISTLRNLSTLRGSSYISERPRHTTELIKQGYVNKHYGISPVDLWCNRFAKIERHTRTDDDGKVITLVRLELYDNHLLKTREELINMTAQDQCMNVARECYDLGRRKNLFGVSSRNGKHLTVLDAFNVSEKKAWLEALTEAGLTSGPTKKIVKKNPDSIKEGWITKKAGSFSVSGSWSSRYAVLAPGVLMYYKLKGDRSPQNVLTLHSGCSVEDANEVNDCNRPFALRVITPERTFLMSTYDASIKKEWMTAVNKACGRT